MNAKRLNFWLLSALVVAAVLLGWQQLHVREMHRMNNELRERAALTTLVGSPEPRQPAGAAANANLGAGRAAPFDWHAVESEDYRKYIANLRAIGCPEETVKDIVIADVMKLFAARSRQRRAGERTLKYWETDEVGIAAKKMAGTRRQEDPLFAKEMGRLLHDLLGINFPHELERYLGAQSSGDGKLSFLPEAKRARVLALVAEFDWRRGQILEGSAGLGQFDAGSELRRLEMERLEELRAILTPQEMEEFEMTTSETGERLRSLLVGFHPTEGEFRGIFLLQKAFAEKWEGDGAWGSRTQEERVTAEAELERDIRRVLGAARFADYQRSQDSVYRSLCMFCAENGVSSD